MYKLGSPWRKGNDRIQESFKNQNIQGLWVKFLFPVWCWKALQSWLCNSLLFLFSWKTKPHCYLIPLFFILVYVNKFIQVTNKFYSLEGLLCLHILFYLTLISQLNSEELLGGNCVYLISNILEVSVETPMHILNY